MPLDGAIDQHANSNVVAITLEAGNRIIRNGLRNDGGTILSFIDPYKPALADIVVEPTYNWYQLVDLLMGDGFRIYVTNPFAITPCAGPKHANDIHDVLWYWN